MVTQMNMAFKSGKILNYVMMQLNKVPPSLFQLSKKFFAIGFLKLNNLIFIFICILY